MEISEDELKHPDSQAHVSDTMNDQDDDSLKYSANSIKVEHFCGNIIMQEK